MRNALRVALIAIALSGCSPPPQVEYRDSVSFLQAVTPAETRGEGARAPHFSWLDASGQTVSFHEYARGRPALINFWATWWVQSRVQIPEIKKTEAEYASKGVVIIGVDTLDWKEPPSLAFEHVSRFTKDWKMGYPVIIDGKKRGESPLWNAFGLQGAPPVSVLIDKQGRIVKTLSGIHSKEQLAAELEKLL